MSYAHTTVARRLAVSGCTVAVTYALTWSALLDLAERNLEEIGGVILINYDIGFYGRLMVNGMYNAHRMWMDAFGGAALLYAAVFPLVTWMAWRSGLPKRVHASLLAVGLAATFSIAAPITLGRLACRWMAGSSGDFTNASDGLLEVFLGTRAWSLGGWLPGSWTGFSDPMPLWESYLYPGALKLLTWEFSPINMRVANNEVAQAVASVGPPLAVAALVSTVVALLAFGLCGGMGAAKGRSA